MQRLTDEQRDLAGLPESLAIADYFAWKYARNQPKRADDIRSAAYVGLCEAAARFDPARGIKFSSFAEMRVRGAILDYLRNDTGEGLGCGRTMLARGDSPSKFGLSEVARTMSREGATVRASEVIVSEDLPVGWEIESEDTVTVYAARFPGKAAAAIRAYYLRAEIGTMKAAGEAVGVKESRVSQMHTNAVMALREDLTRGF